MSDAGASETLVSWWTKQEAADQLQTSVRSIERRISAGEIESRKRRKDGPKLQYETVVNPVDVQKLMPSAHVMPATETTPTASSRAAELPPQTPNIYDFLQALLATVATSATAPRQPAASEKPWLTLEEAATRSGLTVPLLKELCKTRKLQAIRDGREWKIHRKVLDAFEGGDT